MTAPLPPSDGPVPLGDRLDSSLQGGTGPDIQAALPELAGTAAAAQAAGNAWCAGAAEWADSAQGAGSDGFGLTDAGVAADWPTDMSFPHQGP